MKLASNPNTPLDILEELAKHPNEWIQRCLQRNPSAKAILEQERKAETE